MDEEGGRASSARPAQRWQALPRNCSYITPREGILSFLRYLCLLQLCARCVISFLRFW